MMSVLFQFINFGILIAILYKYSRKPVTEAVEKRHEDFKKKYENAQKELVRATRQNSESKEKIKNAERDIQILRKDVQEQIESQKLKIVTEAKRVSDQLKQEAVVSSEQLWTEFKTTLRVQLADKVIERAKGHIHARITADDKSRLQKDFSQQIGRQS